MSRIIARPREVLILLFSFVAFTLLGSKHGSETLGLLARSAHCTNVYLASLIAGVQEAGLNVHDIFLVSGSADVLGYGMSPSSACCSGTSKQISRIRAVARTVSSSRRISGRTVELVNGHESFLALSNRGALSILDVSFKFARTSSLASRKSWSTVGMEHRRLRL